VSRQVDLKGDGILGRDFLRAMQARICYESKALTFQHEGTVINKKLGPLPESKREVPEENCVRKINLTARTETIVQLPVSAGSKMKEGLVEKVELVAGVYLAESLVKVTHGQIITSILNTREQDIEIPVTEVKLMEQDNSNESEVLTIGLTDRGKTAGGTNLSRGEEVLAKLRTKHFTCLDMIMGYHQIELEPGEGPKTAFSTKQGHWKHKRLPFGLKTAPATFQKMMNSVLSGLTGTRCFVYLDDTVLYAKSLADHNGKLREVLYRLRTYQLKLQPDKCEFLRTEVSYLGHQITESGVRPDPQKVAAIEQFPTPTDAKKLKTFCGMVSYYRRFIPNCSKIASPLYKLLKKDARFERNEPQENAFQHLKAKLVSRPILQYPDFSKEFILTTDASNQGLGAVLSQGPVGKDLPIAYASRRLNSAEVHYTVSEKELLSVVWATKYFRPYLYGRRFKVVSDHKPLVWVMNVKDPGSRLMRWRIQLAEYDYEIVHKRGTQNTNADALSRIGSVTKVTGQLTLRRRIKSHLLFAGIIRSSPFSLR